MPVTGRQLALRELSALRRSGDEVFQACIERIRSEQRVDKRDIGLAERIFIGTFQNREYIDYCLAEICGSKYRSIHPLLKDILRLSAYQIMFLDRIPIQAVVNEGVNLARKKLNPGAASMANAVLRRLASTAPEYCILDHLSAAEKLSIRYSHPLWLVNELINRVGEKNAQCFLSLDNEPAPIWLQINTDKIDLVSALNSLNDNGNAEIVNGVPGCLRLHSMTAQAEKFLKDGFAYVQDISAKMATIAAGIKPGDTVLDTCAAPGGKSFSAALAMSCNGRIISSDISEKRLKMLEENAERLSFDIIETRLADASDSNAFSDVLADVVLVDAPCSGFGTIRKKPEIRVKSPEDIRNLHDIQYKILSNASNSVKSGAVLIYSTCTIFTDENENVVKHFLSEHADFELLDFVLPSPFGNSSGGMYTIWPWIAGSDGFFIAKLRRK